MDPKGKAQYKLIFIIFALSATFRLSGLGYPNSVVFDEVHFGKFINAYVDTGKNFFDIHPPHAKLLIAGTAKTFQYEGKLKFDAIGKVYDQESIIPLRIFPALTGILLPIVIFLLLLEMGCRPFSASLGAIILSLDNSLIVQTRIIALDGLLLLGIFSSFLLALKASRAETRRKSIVWSLLAGFAAGFAVGSKFTGLTALGMAFCVFFMDWFFARERTVSGLKAPCQKLIWLATGFTIVYLGGWYVHFALLKLPGSGDAFYKNTGAFLVDLVKLHQVMIKANTGLTQGHHDASVWWSWPLLKTPVFYWSAQAKAIYFLGNPFLWWGGSLLFMAAIFRHPKGLLLDKERLLVLIGFLGAYVPYILVSRALFLYHFMPPLCFIIVGCILYLDRQDFLGQGTLRQQKRFVHIALLVLAIGLLFIAPLTYGFKYPNWYGKFVFNVFPGWR